MRNAPSPRPPAARVRALRLAALLTLAPVVPACGGTQRPTSQSRESGADARGSDSGGAAPGSVRAPAAQTELGAGLRDGPCDPVNLELSEPRGKVLRAGKLILRWRSRDSGPFQVRVLAEDGRTVYGTDTYGHELRVLVGPGDDRPGTPSPGQLESGRTYRWRVVPQFAPDPSACPTAEFRLLSENESREVAARFDAAAQRLGVGDDDREPDASLTLAQMYVKEGFDDEAERLLQRLRESAYEDERIERVLEEIYGREGRRLSLQELKEAPRGGPAAF